MDHKKIANDWADGPWKYPTEKRKTPFIQREVWGWILGAAIIVGSALILTKAGEIYAYDVINGDPMEVVE